MNCLWDKGNFYVQNFVGRNGDHKDVSLLWFIKTQFSVTGVYLNTKLVQKACAGKPPALQLLVPLDVSYVLTSASCRTLCLCTQRYMCSWVANCLLKQDIWSIELWELLLADTAVFTSPRESLDLGCVWVQALGGLEIRHGHDFRFNFSKYLRTSSVLAVMIIVLCFM